MSETNKLKIEFCSNNWAANCPYIHVETVGKDYIKYGDDNLAPEFLLELFRNSSLQNALVSSKANYVTGGGFINKTPNQPVEAFIKKCNNLGESLNDILAKCSLDYEIFGGFALQVVYNKLKTQINEIYYVDVSKIRFTNIVNEKAKNKKPILFSQDWRKYKINVLEYDSFNPEIKVGTQIFYYKGKVTRGYYPEPQYIAAIRDIQTNIEISKFNLNEIKNGLFPSLHINFKNGNPTDEEKDLILRSINNWYGGANNAGKAMVTFSDTTDNSPDITPVQQNDNNDRFIQLDESVTSAILKGHRVVSPVLFGVSTPGKLGTSNELSEAYILFKNTYVVPTQKEICRQFNIILSTNWKDTDLDIIPTEPINNDFIKEEIISSAMTLNEVRTKLKEGSWITDIDTHGEPLFVAKTGVDVSKGEDINVNKDETIN